MLKLQLNGGDRRENENFVWKGCPIRFLWPNVEDGVVFFGEVTNMTSHEKRYEKFIDYKIHIR